MMATADPRTVHSFSIIHLGELFRWNLLFNAMSCEGLWLKNNRMHTWIVGSIMAVLYMPIVAQIGCDNAMRVSFSLCCRCSGLIILTVSIVDARGGKPW